MKTKRITKSADEMFEALGYELYQGKTYAQYEKNSNHGSMIQINIYDTLEFDKLSYPIGRDWDSFPEAITMAENKAIQKKLKELKKEGMKNEWKTNYKINIIK